MVKDVGPWVCINYSHSSWTAVYPHDVIHSTMSRNCQAVHPPWVNREVFWIHFLCSGPISKFLDQPTLRVGILQVEKEGIPWKRNVMCKRHKAFYFFIFKNTGPLKKKGWWAIAHAVEYRTGNTGHESLHFRKRSDQWRGWIGEPWSWGCSEESRQIWVSVLECLGFAA